MVGVKSSRVASRDDMSRVMSARLVSPRLVLGGAAMVLAEAVGRPGRGLLRTGAERFGAASLTNSE